jgi:alkylation response protein AidB-like acyl-CoA dehydrogenase
MHEITEGQQERIDRARTLAEKWLPMVAQWDREDKAPVGELLAMASAEGLLGLTIPEAHGGLGGLAIDYSLCVEEMARVSHSVMPPEVLFRTSGPGPTIILAATNPRCIEKFLPDIVAGRRTCAIALTEPEHGSDLTDLETTAADDGHGGFVLNGAKRFVTGCPDDDLYATFVRFGGIPGPRGIGAVIVEKGTPGLTLDFGAEVAGARGMPHGTMAFEDCPVPAENLVVPAGHFPQLMQAFNVERLHNCSVSIGLAQGAYELAVEYTTERRQFGRPVIEFQSVYHTLADMWVKIEAARGLVHKAALTAVDGRFPRALEVSAAKLMANEVGMQVVWQAMQLHGGDGITRNHLVELSYRDMQAAWFGGGTAPVLKNFVASQLLGRKFDQHAS